MAVHEYASLVTTIDVCGIRASEQFPVREYCHSALSESGFRIEQRHAAYRIWGQTGLTVLLR